MKIHLVYPHQDKKTAPNIIGFKLYQELSKLYDVKIYNWDESGVISPEKGDVLIGHPHPVAHTILRRSAKKTGWHRKIILQPFNTDWRQISYIDQFIDDFDSFLAISGKYWFDQINTSKAIRWKPKLRRIDMAVDLHQFKSYKKNFNQKYKRKFIYIGSDHPGKNINYLNEIAKKADGIEFAWAGGGKTRSHIKSLGYVDISSEAGKKLLANFDFMITVGSADSNPTTILESVGLGLIPVCTETSGYYEGDGILNIASKIDDALLVIKKLQEYSDSDLIKLLEIGYKNIETNYNWNIFIDTVIDEINSKIIYKTEIKIKKEKIEYIYPYRYFLIRYVINNIKYILRKTGLL